MMLGRAGSLRITCLVLAACAGIAGSGIAGCGGRSVHEDYGDCYQEGTCECARQEHCPAGQHCINGVCGNLVDAAWPLKHFGEPCLEDAECESGRCLGEGPGNGGVCTRECGEEPCPTGWECKPQANRDPRDVLLCVQEIPSNLCRVCSVDAHCNAIGDLCLMMDQEFFCAEDCTFGTCPAGYVCSDVPVGNWTARQCLPEGGKCECTATTVGLTRLCSKSNAIGECFGYETCLAGEVWSECDAREPAQEICSGEDDDCDGLTDALDPGIDVSSLPSDPPYPMCSKGQGEGNCLGVWTCVEQQEGGYDWMCTAADPEEEVCNGRDDDCDGLTDEDFVDGQGRYVHVEHCGYCSMDCNAVVPHLLADANGDPVPGAVECQVRSDAPTCVPILCEPGYYPYPESAPVTCAELVSPACRPCTGVSDCIVSTDRCVDLASDRAAFCLQSCDPSSYYVGCTGTEGVQDCCPNGYLCELVQGEKLCMPVGESCRCNADKLGTIRPCTLTGGGGTTLCQGEQTCEQIATDTYVWSDCVPSTATVEVCDGLDNNCNGETDEDFRGPTGLYDTDEHCGQCNNNCLARWNQEIQHAIGGCVFRPPATLRCEIVQCTSEAVPGKGPCRLDSQCGAGWTCHPRFYQCVRTCNTATNCDTGQTCLDGWCGRPCSTTAECVNLFGANSQCLSGVCQLDYQYKNTDAEESNGCECPASVPSGQDTPEVYDVYPEPGWPYPDRDCDGVDGNAGKALYVWSGSALSLGTRDDPYLTIQEALAAYNPVLHNHILVAAGTYHGNLDVLPGVKLYGGYAPDFAVRDVVLYPSVILGYEPDHSAPGHKPGTVYVNGVTGTPTVIAGFTIHAYDVNTIPAAGQAGYSSYAVYVKDSNANLVIANNRIYGGRGGDAATGTYGTTGGNGGSGADGQDSWECPNSDDCAGYTRAGGTGGTNASCTTANGRPGATARGSAAQDPQDYTSTANGNGRGGYNSTYSHSDPSQWNLCKYDCVVGSGDGDGQDAQNGSDGAAGSGGAGCSSVTGQVVSGKWRAYGGANGANGSGGTGGGGGGAGGAVQNDNGNTNCSVLNPWGDIGASGAGGGAGGCGGTRGNGGAGGGGAFAVFLYFSGATASVPVIQANRIYLGNGGVAGDGGAGGQGGRGGPGGRGGETVFPAWCAGAGGSGGRGGDGGAGGGGGGGCGGSSFGIAGNHASVNNYASQNVFEAPPGSGGGSGGGGGPSPAGGQSNGTGGTAGSSGNTLSL